MTRPVYMTRVTNEDASMEGGMQKVTPEYFADKGFSEDELRQIAGLEVDQLWLGTSCGCDRSIRRVA